MDFLGSLRERLWRWVRQRQRKYDVEILWPACVDTAEGDIEQARRMFLFHASYDPAWQGFDQIELQAFVAMLK